MPAIKNALLRYRIIDRSIRNEYKPYPTKEDLRQACEEEIFGTSEGYTYVTLLLRRTFLQ